MWYGIFELTDQTKTKATIQTAKTQSHYIQEKQIR